MSEWEQTIEKSDKDKFIAWLRRNEDSTITPHLIQRAINEL